MKPKEKKDYAVVYYDNYNTYQVQLFAAPDMPLERLKAKVEKFNRNEYGRKAAVVTDPVVVGAFQYFHEMRKDLSLRMKRVENALYNLENDIQVASFVKVAIPKENGTGDQK